MPVADPILESLPLAVPPTDVTDMALAFGSVVDAMPVPYAVSGMAHESDAGTVRVSARLCAGMLDVTVRFGVLDSAALAVTVRVVLASVAILAGTVRTWSVSDTAILDTTVRVDVVMLTVMNVIMMPANVLVVPTVAPVFAVPVAATIL
jgi:hypothetical protein